MSERLAIAGSGAIACGLAAGVFAVETVLAEADLRTAALDCAGMPMTEIAARKQKSRENATIRRLITGKPLCPKLLRNVSAL